MADVILHEKRIKETKGKTDVNWNSRQTTKKSYCLFEVGGCQRYKKSSIEIFVRFPIMVDSC